MRRPHDKQTTKRLYDEHKNQTYPIHQVGDWKHCQNCHPSDFHKTTHQGEGFLEEDSPEVEDFLEVEDSLEEGDTQVEEEYRLEDHQGVVGDRRWCLYHRNHRSKEN